MSVITVSSGTAFLTARTARSIKRVLAQRRRALLVLQPGIELREKRHRGDAELVQRAALLDEVRDVQAENPRHRGDRLGPALALDDEKRRDEIAGAQHRVLDQRAEAGRAAQAPRAVGQIELEGVGHVHRWLVDRECRH